MDRLFQTYMYNPDTNECVYCLFPMRRDIRPCLLHEDPVCQLVYSKENAYISAQKPDKKGMPCVRYEWKVENCILYSRWPQDNIYLKWGTFSSLDELKNSHNYNMLLKANSFYSGYKGILGVSFKKLLEYYSINENELLCPKQLKARLK